MIRRAAFACVLAALAAAPAAAQQPAEVQQPAAGRPAEQAAPPAAIAPSEIPGRAEDLTTRIGQIRAKLAPGPAVLQVEADLKEMRQEVGRMQEALDPGSLAAAPLRDLENSRYRWAEADDRLERWDEILAARTKVLARSAAELDAAKARWNLTRDSLQEDPSAAALGERVAAVLELIATARREVSNRLNALLTIQNSVSEQRVRVQEGLAAVDAAKEEFRGRLLVPEFPPLWEDLRSDPWHPGLVRESWRRSVDTLREFALRSPARLVLQALLAGVLWSGALLLRRRGELWEDGDPALDGARHALAHPAAGALLVSLVVTRLFHPSAAPLVYTWNGIFLAALLLRLVPRMVRPALRRPVFALAVLVLVHLSAQLLVEGSIVERLLLLAVTAASLTLLWRWRRGDGAANLDPGTWQSVARAGTVVALPVLAVSIAANVWGAVALAGLLTETILFSLAAAVVLFSASRMLSGLLFIALRTDAADSLRMVRLHRPLLQRHLGRLIAFLIALFYGYLVLFVLDLTEPLGRHLLGLLGITWTVGTIEFSLSHVLAFVLAIWVSVLVSRTVRFVLDEDVLPRISLPRGVPGTISMMVHYTILALGFLVALAAAGIQLGRFTILAGALGVGIGFGLQNLVNNFVSGLILIFERPIQTGDTIQVGTGLLGTVRRIGIRSSTVRTFQGAEVIVPNGNLISSEVVNWTLSDRQRRIDLPVGVAYGTDPHRVIDVLETAANRFDDVLKAPDPPVAYFRAFGDSSLDFELRYWTASEDWLRLQSQVVLAVHDALRDAGIEIPFPQRDLHLRSISDEAGRRLGTAPDPTPDTR